MQPLSFTGTKTSVVSIGLPLKARIWTMKIIYTKNEELWSEKKKSGKEKENCWREVNYNVCLLVQNLKILFWFYSDKSPFDKIWTKKEIKKIWQMSIHFIETETLLIIGIQCQTIAVCQTVGFVLLMHESSVLNLRRWFLFSSARSQCPLQRCQCWIYFSFLCLWKSCTGQCIHHTATV